MKPLTVLSLCVFVVWLIGLMPIHASDLDRGTKSLYTTFLLWGPMLLGVVLFVAVWVERRWRALRARR